MRSPVAAVASFVVLAGMFLVARPAAAKGRQHGPRTAGIPGMPYVAMEGGVHDPVGPCYKHALATGGAARAVVGWRFTRAFAAEASLFRTSSSAKAQSAPGSYYPADVTEWSVDVRWFAPRFDVVEPTLLLGYSPESSIRYWHGTAVYHGSSTDIGAGARFRASRHVWMNADLRYRMVRFTRGTTRDVDTGVSTPARIGTLNGDAFALMVGFGVYL